MRWDPCQIIVLDILGVESYDCHDSINTNKDNCGPQDIDKTFWYKEDNFYPLKTFL